MKKLLLLVFVAGLTLISLNLSAQSNKCATMRILEQRMKSDPSILLRMQQSEIATQKWIAEHPKGTKQVITIPVVVHVLWHTATENISDSQIQSQIDVLNEDFRLLNSDTLPDTHPFWVFTADAEVEFCLAAQDPDGNPTNGITRTYTDSIAFAGNGTEKVTAQGGKDNWDPTKYLNLWVCNLDASGGTLGYATFPSDLSTEPENDGVVIRYQAFGDEGTATSPNELGRTATHEIGHWLNLRHIWGDSTCGDDFCADTKVAEDANYGCPTFPHNASSICGTDANGEMYMNYMDYVDDNCMNMFTIDQTIRMEAALNGDRSGLLTSIGCDPVGISEVYSEKSISIYPNPSDGNFSINFGNYYPENLTINVVSLFGAKIKSVNNVSNNATKIDLTELENGAYFLQISSDNNTVTKKVFLVK